LRRSVNQALRACFPVAMPATSIITALWLKKQIRAGEESIVL
jgi:hypothetical protein